MYKSDFYQVLERGGNPGPSAQMSGFIHLFMLAATLNKGIIISNFSIHMTDKMSKIKAAPFGIRLDMEFLCQYVEISNLKSENSNQTTVELEKFITVGPSNNFQSYGADIKRNEKYDLGVMSGIQTYFKRYTYFPPTNFTNPSEFIYLPARRFRHYPHGPSEDIHKFFQEFQLDYDQATIIGICGLSYQIFLSIFQLIDLGGMYYDKNPIRGQSQPPELPMVEADQKYHVNTELTRDAYKATRHPKFIRQLARKFVIEHLGYDPGLLTLENESSYRYDNKFIGVHFRFNPDDFFNKAFLDQSSETLAHKRTRSLNLETVKNLQKSLKNTTFFLENLVQNLQERNLTQHKIIYIASPINIARSFIVNLPANRTFQNYKIVTTVQTSTFLRKFRDDCWMIDTYFGDILSTLEKELMVMSKIFYRSRPSNWSFNQEGYRIASRTYEEVSQDQAR